MNALASPTEANRSGNTGANLRVLKNDSLNGLSLLTRGRECDFVTSRSDNNVATVLLVIDVPRSAWTTCGAPWMPKISFIIFHRQHTRLRGVNMGADNIAGENVDHHVTIEVGALDRAGQFRDVPRIHLPRTGRRQLRDRPGRVAGQPATLLDLFVLGQHPVDR